MTTMEEINATLKAAVRERLDATPADDHKMQGVAEPSSERKTDEDLQQSQYVTMAYDAESVKAAQQAVEALAEHYSECTPPAYATATVAEQTLQAALEAVRDRHKTYGPPAEHFGRTAALVNAAFGTSFTAADWALVMVLDKVARLRGPTPTKDGGVDIAGYGGCYEECRSHG